MTVLKIFWLIRTDSFRIPRFEERQFQIFLDIYSPLCGTGICIFRIVMLHKSEVYSGFGLYCFQEEALSSWASVQCAAIYVHRIAFLREILSANANEEDATIPNQCHQIQILSSINHLYRNQKENVIDCRVFCTC